MSTLRDAAQIARAHCGGRAAMLKFVMELGAPRCWVRRRNGVCFSGRIRSGNRPRSLLNERRSNDATGPVARPCRVQGHGVNEEVVARQPLSLHRRQFEIGSDLKALWPGAKGFRH